MNSGNADAAQAGSREPLYPQLKARPGADRESVRANQRERLHEAMIEAVATYGYTGITTRRLRALAGVSEKTIYAHFPGKEAYFLAFLEQNHIKTVCTRVQWHAGAGHGTECPKGSIYGHARAFTPLLEKPLEGPVYLRSNGGERKLPDLVAALNGQIDIALWGKVDSGPNQGLRNTFEVVPDAPVSKFILEMRGGKKGLLVNSEDLCSKTARQRRAIVRFTGHNGKVEALKPRVANQCKKKHDKKHKGHKRHRTG